MSECLFCKIIRGKQKSEIVYRNKRVVAFKDIAPQAPKHILIIPQKHVASINQIGTADQLLLGEILIVARNLAKKLGLKKTGYRLVINTNKDAGQVVDHLHLHLIGGRPLGSMTGSEVK